MAGAVSQLNARTIEAELAWFSTVLSARLLAATGGNGEDRAPLLAAPPALQKGQSLYADFVLHYGLSVEERLILVLALVPHVRPSLLDSLFQENAETSRGHSEFGGLAAHRHSGFLPTGETALYLIAGNNLEKRFACQELLESRHFFAEHNILALRREGPAEPRFSGALELTPEFLDYFTVGSVGAPVFGQDFPAKRLITNETWDDLVLDPEVLEQVGEIRTWITHGDTLMNELGFARRMKPGFRSLFYGPPGTGKSMTAALLGRETGREVYRIDLSMVVSKYIGETEKNLSRVFEHAAHHDWILFFDEADALFSARTSTRDAHDRYANQEVAYLLQRVEEFGGIVILATNLRDNIDDAFTRRFHSIIHFPMPKPHMRLQLWRNAIPDTIDLDASCDLEALAPRFEVSGGAIMNATRYAALMAVSRGSRVIERKDIEKGIRKELQKEGRSI